MELKSRLTQLNADMRVNHFNKQWYIQMEKKAGYISDGDWGGPMVLEFSNYDLTVIKQRLFAYAKHENFISSMSRDIEMLFALLLGYVNLEKVYKKLVKRIRI